MRRTPFPVQINRNGLRTIAVGTGDTEPAEAALSAHQRRRGGRRSAGDLRTRRRVSRPAIRSARSRRCKRDPGAVAGRRRRAPGGGARSLARAHVRVAEARRRAARAGCRSRAGRPQPAPPSRRHARPAQAARRQAARSAHAMMRDDPIRRMPMALSSLVALALAVVPLPARARRVPSGLPGAGGVLLVDRVAARRRPVAGVLLRTRARCDQRRGARSACARAHADGAPGRRICACACGCFRCCRNR